MNKYPERKYENIEDALFDGDLDTDLRENVEVMYKHMTEESNKYALKQVNWLINSYINNKK